MANPETIEGSWGIDPVPSRLHVLSGLETGLLWGNLGVSLLVIVAGAILVPALSLPAALVAIVVGCVIGNAMLAVAGMIGADARVPGMALMRAPLGQRGSLLPTGINVLQGIGWTIFELLVIATAAAALSDELFGFRAQWLWTLVFGACALVLALLGPIGFVRRFIRRFAIWAVPLALLYLTWWAIDGADWSTIWNTDGEGGLSVWQGADVVVGITVSWMPYAADYTRFSRSRRGALAGTGLGYFVPDVWLLALGAVLVLSRGLGDPACAPGCRRRRRFRRDRRAVRAARDGDGRGLRERLLGGSVAPERRAARAAEAAHRGRHRDRHGRSTHRRLRELPELPAPARIGVRAALRGAPCGLARGRSALHGRRHLRLASVEAWPDRRVDRRVRALPVALPDRARHGGWIWSAG